MIDNEDYIKQLAGKDNPFSVPDGYFDTLASRLLSDLPDEQPSHDDTDSPAATIVAMPRRHGLRVLLYAAACLCIAVCGVSLYFAKLSPTGNADKPTAAATHIQTATTESYEEEMADYAMMDNSDIYAYLASNE